MATAAPGRPPGADGVGTRRPAGPLQGTPDAERYVLAADVMRRRQLRSAMLHGSARTWREHRRTWPAVLIGVLVVAVTLAVLAVMDAYSRQKQINEEREQELGATGASAALAPAEPTGAVVIASRIAGAG